MYYCAHWAIKWLLQFLFSWAISLVVPDAYIPPTTLLGVIDIASKLSILLHAKLCKLYPSFSRCVYKKNHINSVYIALHYWWESNILAQKLSQKQSSNPPTNLPSSCCLLMVTQPLQILRLSVDRTKRHLIHITFSRLLHSTIRTNWTNFCLLIKLVSVLLAQNLTLRSVDTIKTYLNNYSI